ncbi:MAG: hypothetical protein ACLR4Z_13955 [Butyricicoccaceae bacterium]
MITNSAVSGASKNRQTSSGAVPTVQVMHEPCSRSPASAIILDRLFSCERSFVMRCDGS